MADQHNSSCQHQAARAPRIAYAVAQEAPDRLFARVAGLGFTHVMLPPPWPSAAGGARWLSTDFDRLDESFGGIDLPALVGRARAAGLALMLDVVLDRLAAGNALVGAPGSPFVAPDPALFLDPRASEGLVAHAHPGAAPALAAWWAPHLRAWAAAGVAGFRLLGIDRAGELAEALRQAVPGVLLLPWEEGAIEADDVAQGEPARICADAHLPGASGDVAPPAPARHPALCAMLGQGWLHRLAPTLSAEQAAMLAWVNQMRASQPLFSDPTPPVWPLGDSFGVRAVLRQAGGRAAMLLVNDTDLPRAVAGASLLPSCGGAFGPFTDPTAGDQLLPETQLTLAAGAAKLFLATATASPAPHTTPLPNRAAPRLAIEAIAPAVLGGACAVKAIAGEMVTVQADILCDGHDALAACLCWQAPDETAWHEVAMRPLGNDRWQASFPLRVLGLHGYVIKAWRDRFASFRDELGKKAAAGLDVALELAEGCALVEASRPRQPGLAPLLAALAAADAPGRVALLLAPQTEALMRAADDRPFCVTSPRIAVRAERLAARFAAWYEIFPRSMSDDPARHGTFADVERHLPRIQAMGFDVLYFPPISPIGRVNRKGRNNALVAGPDDPGSPYAVGSAEGGHDALHPALGTLADFQHLRAAAAAHGLELALDFAIQCAPDHPWLTQHPGWFDWRPDGTVRYAENPPKKYEDIVNVDFYAPDAVPDLWMALCDVVLFWAEQGVRLFRVDNPHTKPFPFWEWMIARVQLHFPDALFLAEAFTRPKLMYRLAKIGFSQSYTYFTWRNSKREIEEYLRELDQPDPADYFRPHFFVNTPDINPLFLQAAGRAGFLIRAALAATLSGLWGVYCGFELCEAAALAGREEYADSEKYQLRAWDWDRPGQITADIAALNRIRRAHPALQTHRGVRFLPASSDDVLFYEKSTPDRTDIVLIAVSLDPHAPRAADVEIPLWSWNLPDDAALTVEDLLSGAREVWHGSRQRVMLTPERPYVIWQVRKEGLLF